MAQTDGKKTWKSSAYYAQNLISIHMGSLNKKFNFVSAYCQTPHPNEDPKDQFGFGVTLKSKSLVPIRIKNNEVMKMKITS